MQAIQRGRRLTVNFHGVGTPHSRVDDGELPYWCGEPLFGQLLDTIRRLIDAGADVDITFDDGNKSDLLIATPALAARNLTATFFICSGRLDDPNYVSAADILTMEAAGMIIGSHGRDHVDLRRLSDADLAAETQGAKRTLEQSIGHSIDTFAVPFGSYDRRVLRAAAQFQKIFTSDHQLSRPGANFVARHSYVPSWKPDTPEQILRDAPGPVRQLAQSAKIFLKRRRAAA